MNYRRFSICLDKRQAYQVKRLAYPDKWEIADLLLVLIVLGLRQELHDTEHLTRRVIRGPAVSRTLRSLKAGLASSLAMDLHLLSASFPERSCGSDGGFTNKLLATRSTELVTVKFTVFFDD